MKSISVHFGSIDEGPIFNLTVNNVLTDYINAYYIKHYHTRIKDKFETDIKKLSIMKRAIDSKKLKSQYNPNGNGAFDSEMGLLDTKQLRQEFLDSLRDTIRQEYNILYHLVRKMIKEKDNLNHYGSNPKIILVIS